MRMPGALFPAAQIQEKAEVRRFAVAAEASGIKMPFPVVRLVIADDASARRIRCEMQKMRRLNPAAQDVARSAFRRGTAVRRAGKRLQFNEFLNCR